MRRLFKDEDVKFKKLTQWDQEAFFHRCYHWFR